MMSSSGSSSSGDQRTEIRYAPYVESRHTAFLGTVASYRASLTGSSPFAGYSNIPLDVAFFGAGYTIANFDALYDKYGTHMTGINIDTIYSEIFEDTVNSTEVDNLVAAEAALMDEDIEQNSIPRLMVGASDINSVISDTFTYAKARIESTRLKALAAYRAKVKLSLVQVAVDRWKTKLGWNTSLVMKYAEIMKLYFSAKMDVDDYNYTMAAKDKLWPFTVLEYERAALGALQGATNANKSVAGSSTAAKVVSGALMGAAGASMMGAGMAAPLAGASVLTGPAGLALGAGLGMAAAFL